MRFFKYQTRPTQNPTHVPQLRVGVAHLIGPGTLRREQERLMFEAAERRQLRLDLEGLELILVYGEVTFTSGAMALLERTGVACALLSPRGDKLRSRLVSERTPRVLSRLLHLKSWEDPIWQLTFARQMVVDKVSSQQEALRHYQRQGKKVDRGVLRKLEQCIADAAEARQVEQLRGIEGAASAAWWRQYGRLFRSPWKFTKRVKRPPTDPVNALLSLTYMTVYRRVAAAIEARGYEASLGALHEYRPGRLSLACDLMEPLRVPAVDRWVLALCQQGLVRTAQFESCRDTGGVRLTKESLPDVLGRFEEHWHQGLFRHKVDELVQRFVCSLEENVAVETSRAKAWLKRGTLQAARRGSGDVEVEL